jgi:hypothetical protein
MHTDELELDHNGRISVGGLLTSDLIRQLPDCLELTNHILLLFTTRGLY